MMDFLNRDVLLHVLQRNSNKENVKLLDWKILKDNKVINGFASDPKFISVEYENETGKHTRSFFVKLPFNATNDLIISTKAHEKEVYIYKAILSEFEKLIDYRVHPACYYSDVKGNLILEDLCANGYRVYPQYEFLDFEHTIKAMQVLATYHALSHKLLQISPELFNNDLMENLLNATYNDHEKYGSTCKEEIPKIIRQVDPSFWNKYADKLEIFAENVIPKATKELRPQKNSFNVLVHFDFRSGNLMFKYDKYQNLEDVKIIDHQTSYVSDPSVDIINYVMQSIEFEMFEKYFDVFLEVYVNSLNRFLKYLQCDRTYTIDNLRADIANKRNYWVQQMTILIPVVLANPNDVDKDLLFTDEATRKGALYETFMKKWFGYFIETGKISATN